MKNHSILFFSSPFSFRKPLKSIIQLFTNSKYEHCSRYCFGKVYNTNGEGFRLLTLEQAIKNHSVKGTKVYYLEPKEEFEAGVSLKINEFDNGKIGKKYDAIAAMSSVDEIQSLLRFWKRKDGTYCSGAVHNSLVAGGILQESKDLKSPIELLKELQQSPFYNKELKEYVGDI